MKANVARKIALKNTDSEIVRQCIAILNTIKAEAEKGKLVLWYYEPLLPETRAKLEALGYTVGATAFDRNEYLTKISW